MDTQSRPTTIHVCRDTTPGTHPTDSDEIAWWLPVIGPTASVVAHLFTRTTAPEGTTWHIPVLARRVGLGGSCRKLWLSLDRLAMFGVVTFHGCDVVTIRTELPTLTPHQLERLPADLAAEYAARFHTQAA
jgi:hypothetical protein